MTFILYVLTQWCNIDIVFLKYVISKKLKCHLDYVIYKPFDHIWKPVTRHPSLN